MSGRREDGIERLRSLAALGSPAFGCIAAEADLGLPATPR